MDTDSGFRGSELLSTLYSGELCLGDRLLNYLESLLPFANSSFLMVNVVFAFLTGSACVTSVLEFSIARKGVCIV